MIAATSAAPTSFGKQDTWELLPIVLTFARHTGHPASHSGSPRVEFGCPVIGAPARSDAPCTGARSVEYSTLRDDAQSVMELVPLPMSHFEVSGKGEWTSIGTYLVEDREKQTISED